MPRQKKERLKKRKDGRFRCVYKGIYFYSNISADDALRQRDDYKKQESTGIYQNTTVSEYALPWIRRSFPEVADSTYTGLAIHLQHLIDEIGDKPISTVVPSDIKQVYSDQYKGRSNSYLKAAKQLYSSLFDSAVADGLISANPARDKTAKPHKGKPPRTRPITDQEREYILSFCTDHRAFPAVMAMLYAGLRPQEAKALIIERDIDFDRNIIRINETAHVSGCGYEYTAEGKTENANREIPLFPPLKKVLSGRTGNLISSAHGERVTQTTWRVAWESYCFEMETAINGIQKRWYGKTKAHKALIAAGQELPPWIPFDIVPYNLRHSFCTMCRDAGVEINTCRRWMGHADAKMILKVYDSVSEDRSARERLKVENGLIQGQNQGQENEPAAGMIEK